MLDYNDTCLYLSNIYYYLAVVGSMTNFAHKIKKFLELTLNIPP